MLSSGHVYEIACAVGGSYRPDEEAEDVADDHYEGYLVCSVLPRLGLSRKACRRLPSAESATSPEE